PLQRRPMRKPPERERRFLGRTVSALPRRGCFSARAGFLPEGCLPPPPAPPPIGPPARTSSTKPPTDWPSLGSTRWHLAARACGLAPLLGWAPTRSSAEMRKSIEQTCPRESHPASILFSP